MIDVRTSAELQATIFALKSAERRVKPMMKAAARKRLNAIWRPALQARAANELQRRTIVKGARAKVGSDDFTMLAATSRRALSGGMTPDTQWHGAELGATPRRATVTINGHRRDQVINRNFGFRTARGKVAFPAARETGPRIVAGWVEGVVAGLVAGTELETT